MGKRRVNPSEKTVRKQTRKAKKLLTDMGRCAIVEKRDEMSGLFFMLKIYPIQRRGTGRLKNMWR